MAYDLQLAERIRTYLQQFPALQVAEKKMFRGVSFMVNEKMAVNVSGDKLMCRLDPALHHELSYHPGYEPMLMKDRVYKGYCYVSAPYFKSKKDFTYWLTFYLDFNDKAKAIKKKKLSCRTGINISTN
jgi:TfoX/Sxy family transcriptional regulator of competence genes